MSSILVGDRAYSSGRRILAIEVKQLESKSHVLKLLPARRLALLSTPSLSINAYTHSLERSARTRLQPECPSLTSSQRQEEAFQHFWSARTT